MKYVKPNYNVGDLVVYSTGEYYKQGLIKEAIYKENDEWRYTIENGEKRAIKESLILENLSQ